MRLLVHLVQQTTRLIFYEKILKEKLKSRNTHDPPKNRGQVEDPSFLQWKSLSVLLMIIFDSCGKPRLPVVWVFYSKHCWRQKTITGERRQLTQVLSLNEESKTDLKRCQDIPKDRNKYFIPRNVYFLCPHIIYIYF